MKPEFFGHEGLFDLEHETGLPLRLAFCGLWTVCDREGRFAWRPRTIKRDVLPYDDVDFAAVLDALHRGGFVHRYQVDGEDLGHVPSWPKHQKPHHKEPPSSRAFPTCCGGRGLDDSSMADASMVDDASTYSDSDSDSDGSDRRASTQEEPTTRAHGGAAELTFVPDEEPRRGRKPRKPLSQHAGVMGALAKAYLADRGEEPIGWTGGMNIAVAKLVRDNGIDEARVVAAYGALLRSDFDGFADASPFHLVKYFTRWDREARGVATKPKRAAVAGGSFADIEEEDAP